MKRKSGSMFWGFVIILLGIGLLFDNFGINIDVWKFFWPILIIVLGLRLIFKPNKKCCDGDVIFDEGVAKATKDKNEYSAVFGSGEFDFRELELDKDKKYEVSAVFGRAVVKIKKDTPLKIKASTAFGEITFPDGKSAAFGERVYEKNLESKDNYLNLHVSAVSGTVEIVEV